MIDGRSIDTLTGGAPRKGDIMRRLQVVYLLDSYHKAGAWTLAEEKDAQNIMSLALGDDIATWAEALTNNTAVPAPTDPGWPEWCGAVKELLRGALDALDTPVGDLARRGGRGGRPSSAGRTLTAVGGPCRRSRHCILDDSRNAHSAAGGCVYGCRRCETATHRPYNCPAGPWDPDLEH